MEIISRHFKRFMWSAIAVGLGGVVLMVIAGLLHPFLSLPILLGVVVLIHFFLFINVAAMAQEIAHGRPDNVNS